MFFQLWAVRLDPFNVLENGDTLWWADQRSRQVRWQMTVRNVRRRQCASIESAREYLRRWYGIFPGDLNNYRTDGSFKNGWLLAWENELVASCSVDLPADFKLGRNGFRRVAPAEVKALGLKPSRRRPLRVVQPLEEVDLLAPPRERAIPAAIAREVWRRDGRRCCACATKAGPFHLDHIYPWSKGGPNSLDNLQVLCAPCNLAKAARVSGKIRPDVPSLASLKALAGRVFLPPPTTPSELEAVLRTAAASIPESELVAVAWQVVLHEDASGPVCRAVSDGLYGHTTTLNVWVHLIDAMIRGEEDPKLLALIDATGEIGAGANAYVCMTYNLNDTALVLASRRALKSSHPYLAACGHLMLGSNSTNAAKAREHMRNAFRKGNHAVAAVAARNLGACLSDRSEAIDFLLYAVRANNREIAADAAQLLAARFDDEPDIAAYYLSKAAEARTLARDAR